MGKYSIIYTEKNTVMHPDTEQIQSVSIGSHWESYLI